MSNASGGQDKEDLEDRILEAVRLYSEGSATAADKRNQLIQIILSLRRLLSDRLGSEFGIVMVQLAAALDGLGQGKVLKILAPAPFPNRHPGTITQELVKAVAAAHMDLLHECCGMPMGKAAKRVADILGQAQFDTGTHRGKNPAKTVAAWRNDLRLTTPRNFSDEAVRAYWFIEGEKASPMTESEVVKNLLDYATLSRNA